MDEQGQEEVEGEPGFLHIVEDGDIIITGRITNMATGKGWKEINLPAQTEKH